MQIASLRRQSRSWSLCGRVNGNINCTGLWLHSSDGEPFRFDFVYENSIGVTFLTGLANE